jgi:hypothetical protein
MSRFQNGNMIGNMADAGLDPDSAAPPLRKGSPSGKFPDPWGDDETNTTRMHKSSPTFEKGDRVRLRATSEVGEVSASSRGHAVVKWSSGSLGIHAFENLVLA